MEELRKHVRDALEHLYDSVHLEIHPLLGWLVADTSSNRLTRAQHLRSVLKETVEALRPERDLAPTSPEWRTYLALHLRYIRGMSMGEVTEELGISLRQLQRELHKGLDAVTAYLWETRSVDGDKISRELVEPSEIQELQSELESWDLVRQACDALAIIRETLEILERLPLEGPRTLDVQLPESLPPVLLDSTLTRQALLKVLRLVVRASNTAVTVSAKIDEGQVNVVLAGGTSVDLSAGPDWRMAQLLIAKQDGTLHAASASDGITQVVVGLPRAVQASILIVEDNLAIHRLFERYLAPYHCRVIHATDGREAVRLAVETRPDLITLDVMMPGTDGWEILRTLRQLPVTADIPVVVCSVLRDADLAFALGAHAYLKKPVDRSELLATVAPLLPREARVAAGPTPVRADS